MAGEWVPGPPESRAVRTGTNDPLGAGDRTDRTMGTRGRERVGMEVNEPRPAEMLSLRIIQLGRTPIAVQFLQDELKREEDLQSRIEDIEALMLAQGR